MHSTIAILFEVVRF